MTMEIRDGRGVGKDSDHCFLHLDHLPPELVRRKHSTTKQEPHAQRRSGETKKNGTE